MSRSIHGTHVIDAGALVNLEAVDDVVGLVDALELRFITSTSTLAELRRARAPSRLEAAERLRSVQLTDDDCALIEMLVGVAPPDDLGDDEAASTAFAQRLDLPMLIDDPKARRVLAKREPRLVVVTSIEVFAAAHAAPQYGPTKTRLAVQQACERAHMRLPPQFRHLIE